MTENPRNRKQVLYAIRSSCIPLLCGNKSAVCAAARRLRRLCGIASYAVFTEKRHILSEYFIPFYVRPVCTAVLSAELLADTAIRFFDGLDQTAIPVLIDCTEDRMLIGDAARRKSLESRCFLSDPSHITDIPPFCYLASDTDTLTYPIKRNGQLS